MTNAGQPGGRQDRALTVADDFAGLVGWRRGRFPLSGRTCVLKIQGQQVSMVELGGKQVFSSPVSMIACGQPAGPGINQGIFRLIVGGTAYNLFGMDLYSMRRVRAAGKKIALADRHHAADLPPQVPDLAEQPREKLTGGVTARIRLGWPTAWVAALRRRGARPL
jgi:hypothetical protein